MGLKLIVQFLTKRFMITMNTIPSTSYLLLKIQVLRKMHLKINKLIKIVCRIQKWEI